MRRFPGSKTNHPAGLLKMIVFVRKLKIKFKMFVSTNSDPFKVIFTQSSSQILNELIYETRTISFFRTLDIFCSNFIYF